MRERLGDWRANERWQSPDAGPIERWAMAEHGRSVAISIEWRLDAGESSPMIAMELYADGRQLASGEAHADYGAEKLFEDLRATLPPLKR